MRSCSLWDVGHATGSLIAALGYGIAFAIIAAALVVFLVGSRDPAFAR